MKITARLTRVLALLGVALATTALAQKEQWLEYHISRDGRGYRYLDLTTTPPPNVALPKFKAKPYFARWTTPLDPAGGRWLCFDRSRSAGPYDRLYLDTKGDGRLDNKSPISASRADEYYAYFDPAKLVFKGEDGPISYHLALRFMQFNGSDVRLLAQSGGYYAGQVDFDGKKRHLELVDGNVNGTFNDRAADAGNCDRVQIDNDKVPERYLGKLLEFDGAFYRIEVARDGAFVKLQKAGDITLGTVRVPEGLSQFAAFGENGHFVRKPLKGEFTLPIGKYRVHEWSIDRKDRQGADWQLMGSGLNDSASFEVAAAKPAMLQVGEPVRVELLADQRPNAVNFNLNFRGQFGESVQLLKNNQRPAGPRLTLVSADGSYRSTNTFEFG